MNGVLDLVIAGIGVWSPEAKNWDEAAAVLSGNVDIATNAASRPAPSILPATERRRAPESVLLGVDVAQQACAMAGIDPQTVPHIFASGYGELVVNDYLCETLAKAPLDVSPIRFHNSVHNAPAGYWSIATGCMRSSTAISAGDETFGAGLLETALVAADSGEPALLAAYDVPAVGPLGDIIRSRTKLGIGVLLATTHPNPLARIRVRTRTGTAPRLASDASVLHASHQENPAAQGLGLLQALARKEPGVVRIAAGPRLMLEMEIALG